VAKAAGTLLTVWEAEKHAQREAEAKARVQREAEAKAKAQQQAEIDARWKAEERARREPNSRGVIATRRPKATDRRMIAAKPQWLVGVSFFMLIVVAVSYLSLRDDNRQGGSFVRPIKQGGTIRFAADSEPPGFNPNTSKDALPAVWNVVINMYPQPFHTHPDFTVKMDDTFLDSAELISTDPQTVVYKIKQNAVWSDGIPVTADDFIYLWRNSNGSIKTNDIADRTGYDQIESVTGSDNGKTVTVVFRTPFGDWKGLFTGILLSHYVEKQQGKWNSGLDKDPDRIPSAGPFLIKEYIPRQTLTMVRNDKYWGQKAYLDEIVYRFLPASITQDAALQNNAVDLVYPQPQLDLVKQVKSLPGVTSEMNLGLIVEQLVFNFKNQHLKDPRVRQAIATGLNIQELVDGTVKPFADKAEPLGNRIWMTGQPQYQDHFGQYGKGDVAGAQKLLQHAGYTKGTDGLLCQGWQAADAALFDHQR
jgi:peptide/nickel transport system substrate-binding protein